jgi:hypothetical protein
LLGVHFVVVELNFSQTQLPCVATSLRTVSNRQRQKIFFKMFSADYPSSPTPSEADMDAMTAHVENRPYHEAFMREAINMVRLFPTKHHPSSQCGLNLKMLTLPSRLSWHLLLTRHQSAVSLFTMAKSSLRA